MSGVKRAPVLRTSSAVRRAAPFVPVLALTALASIHAQPLEIPPVHWPAIVEHAPAAERFVPTGWRIEHRAEGRLDDDDEADLLLLLRMTDPANVITHDGMGSSPFDTNPRMLVVAFADGQGGYRRALVDHALIPRAESPVMDDVLQDDPAATIRIRDNRAFAITLHSWASAGSWSTSQRTFTFRHQDGCFRLIGLDDHALHRGTGEIAQSSINYLTGRAWRSTGSIEDEGEPPKQWHTIPASRRLVCIEQLGDGFGFDPDLPGS